MGIGEYTALGVLIVAIIGLVIRISFVLNSKVSYDAFDRHKKDFRTEFRTEAVCNVLYKGIRADITEMKTDIKALLKMTKNGNK